MIALNVDTTGTSRACIGSVRIGLSTVRIVRVHALTLTAVPFLSLQIILRCALRGAVVIAESGRVLQGRKFVLQGLTNGYSRIE